ncbi:uncharacterized protein K460DRAFT_273182, partial [Cucurbitaria berberidis CBS 394.84]
QQWHGLDVRGVRLNYKFSKTVVSKTDLQPCYANMPRKLRPIKAWSVGLYANMEVLDHVQPLVSELGVKIVLEHFASPVVLLLGSARQPGWDALHSMMKDPRVYVKFSAPYLFSSDSGAKEFESLATSLLIMRNGEGLVISSDWPRTQSRGYYVTPFMEKAVKWCNGDGELQNKLFRDNPRELWDV